MTRSSSAELLKSVEYWPNHLLTIAEWSLLPENNRHCRELVDGVLVVAPQPPRHQLAVWRLAAQLERALPRRVAAMARIELIIDDGAPPTVRVPDVLIVGGEAGAEHATRVRPGDVMAAIEIVSPGSRRVDRIMKFAEYATAGIGHYWLLETEDSLLLRTHRLRDGRYMPTGEYSGQVTLELEGLTLPLDLDALTALRTSGASA
ncbi:Uma2 family endonuclease [Nocardia aurantiaca]|uniref:Uma2 family endonuclease n=1 Tax=Nocardia aurantiaca TaxID=2675850 RepID=A0A6I3L2I9_9NOCA|nr:Uma2 family endonuclease [Nocardia aurantiaca]MTE14834.1 Uma2 family endonuclease [Nocardia aurantiaca]